jgi:O-antigen ligase
LRTPPEELGAPPLTLPILAGLAVLCVSAAFSQDRVLSVRGMYNYYAYGVWPMAMMAGAYFLGAWGMRDAAGLRLGLRAALAAGAAVGLYATLQTLGHEPFPNVGRLVDGRAVATLGSPVSLGAYLAMLVPLALHWALSETPAFGWSCLALILAGLAASISRAAWLAGAVGAAVYLAGSGGLKTLRGPRLYALAVAGLVAAGALYWKYSARSFAKVGELGRISIWKTALAVYKERPLLGIGPDAFELGFRRLKSPDYIRATTANEYQAHAHNDLLEALATAGTAGFLAYLVLLAALARAAWRRWGGPSVPALAASLLALFINMKFNPMPVEVLTLAWLLAGALAPAERSEAPGPAWLKPAAGAALLFGAASLFTSIRLTLADNDAKWAVILQSMQKADLAEKHLESAIAREGCELSYLMAQANLLIERAAQTQPPLRFEYLDRSLNLGRKAVGCHPESSPARFIYGACLLSSAKAGRVDDLGEATRQLDEALRRDPLFLPLLEVRLQAAALGRDAAAMAEVSRRIDEIKNLSK